MPPSNTKNRFDKKDSLKLGEKAEEVFILSAVRQGWKVSASSRDENIDEHWDYLIEKDVTSFKVEVKSGKTANHSMNSFGSRSAMCAARSAGSSASQT